MELNPCRPVDASFGRRRAGPAAARAGAGRCAGPAGGDRGGPARAHGHTCCAVLLLRGGRVRVRLPPAGRRRRGGRRRLCRLHQPHVRPSAAAAVCCLPPGGPRTHVRACCQLTGRWRRMPAPARRRAGSTAPGGGCTACPGTRPPCCDQDTWPQAPPPPCLRCARRAYGGLADGSYTFQVRALGAAGAPATAGPAAAAAFLVDAAPPPASALRFTPAAAGRAAAVAAAPGSPPAVLPAAVAAAPAVAADGGAVALANGAFTATFSVTDGVLGSGVNGCPPSLSSQVSAGAVRTGPSMLAQRRCGRPWHSPACCGKALAQPCMLYTRPPHPAVGLRCPHNHSVRGRRPLRQDLVHGPGRDGRDRHGGGGRARVGRHRAQRAVRARRHRLLPGQRRLYLPGLLRASCGTSVGRARRPHRSAARPLPPRPCTAADLSCIMKGLQCTAHLPMTPSGRLGGSFMYTRSGSHVAPRAAAERPGFWPLPP